jgi:hypothetical protein
VKFKIFKYLKINKNCFKKYISTVIKILNYFSQNPSQMFELTAKFQIQRWYRARDKKKVVRESKKLTSTNFDAPISSLDMGV